jgi:hypothetical protein
MVFNIDPESAIDSVVEALESAGRELSESQFVQVANRINETLPGIIDLLAQGTAEYWKSEASSKGGWGEKYARSIKYKVSGNMAEVFVDENMKDSGSNKPLAMFAKMVEDGVKSWSIKDALLASEKAKTSSDGIKYMVIPFPVATPRKSSSGKGKSQFGGREMTAEMYKIVKSGGKIKSGTLKAGARNVDISGLSKYNTRQLHGQYGIFRCVTKDSQGWIYPGKGEQSVYPDVLEYVNRQVRELVDQFCQAIVKEFQK